MDRYSFVTDVLALEVVAALASVGNRKVPTETRKSIHSKIASIFADAEASLHAGWVDPSNDDGWVKQADENIPANATGRNGINLVDLKNAIDAWWSTVSSNGPDDAFVNSIFSMLRDKNPDDVANEYPFIWAGMGNPATPTPASTPAPEPKEPKEPKETEKPGLPPSNEESPVRKPVDDLKAPVDEFSSTGVPGVPGDGRNR